MSSNAIHQSLPSKSGDRRQSCIYAFAGAHASSTTHVFDGVAGAPIALVVAHPDDEVIGVGGQLPTWAPWLTCVLATDGAPDNASAWRAGCVDANAYAVARVRESCAALACAGIQPAQLVRLTFADQRLALVLDALAASLRRVFTAVRPAIVIAHAYEGSAGMATRRAVWNGEPRRCVRDRLSRT